MDYAKIGARIRAARGIKGLTQERLSEAAGISVSYISEIENGHRALSIDVMERIADVLDVPLEWLLKSDVEKNEQLAHLLRGCNQMEQQILLESIASLKQILQKYIK